MPYLSTERQSAINYAHLNHAITELYEGP